MKKQLSKTNQESVLVHKTSYLRDNVYIILCLFVALQRICIWSSSGRISQGSLPVKVSALSGFFCAQEIADEEKHSPQTQQVTQHYSRTADHLWVYSLHHNYSGYQLFMTRTHIYILQRVNKTTFSNLICKEHLMRVN